MRKRFSVWRLAVLLAAAGLVLLAALGLAARLEQGRLAAGMIRVHVTANSDSEADQALKLRVRDAVLPVLDRLTAGCRSREEAEHKIRAGFPALRAAALGVLSGSEEGTISGANVSRTGAEDGATSGTGDGMLSGADGTFSGVADDACFEAGDGLLRLSLVDEVFPRRDYDTFSLPAGPYRALRLTIGAGAGHNWWCVAFPSLCLPASDGDLAEAAQTAGLDGAALALMTEDTPVVRLKFRLLDWISALFD